MLGLDVLRLVVLALAVFRLTRFITDDDFPPMATVRAWYERKARGAWADLVTCPWCVSLWLAIGAVVAVALAPAIWVDRASLVLALSGVASLVALYSERE